MHIFVYHDEWQSTAILFAIELKVLSFALYLSKWLVFPPPNNLRLFFLTFKRSPIHFRTLKPTWQQQQQQHLQHSTILHVFAYFSFNSMKSIFPSFALSGETCFCDTEESWCVFFTSGPKIDQNDFFLYRSPVIVKCLKNRCPSNQKFM